MNVLVIGAHADDPEVSMGGTISKLTKSNHKVKLLICILPEESRHGNVIEGAKEKRLDYQISSAERLNCELEVLDMNPYTFTFNRDLVKKIDDCIVEFKPDLIFTQWNHDSHQDHKAVAQATFAAARKNDTSVLMYEQLTLGGITPKSFNGNVYIDISETINEKMSSVKCYKFLKESDLDAIVSLARFRGNQIGVEYAECFENCKILTKINESGVLITGYANESK